jgi:pimeloyl-ACP methyl ester carboxylesterase/DNA-binding winged helix-turn-helix (wHTH) protein
MDAQRYVWFPPFRLDLINQCLLRDNLVISLTPKAFAVLKHLIENAGRLVTKQQLLDAVWGEVNVGDGVLKVVIGEIRKALCDGSDAPRFIATAHRRGYRFIADVEIETTQPRAQTAAASAAGAPRRDRQVPIVSTSPRDIDVPETHYTRSGDVNIAYQLLGRGPIDLVFVMGWVSHLEYFWAEPSFARFLRRLASFSRLILFDKRGTGLSDRVPISQLPSLEQRMDDVRAVMEAAGSKRAVLCGVSEGGPMSALFAATHPDKTIALVMIGTYAKRTRDADYPWGPTKEDRERFCSELEEQWGGPVALQDRAPSAASDPAFRNWWATYLRMGASPGAAVALTRMNAEIDVRHVLPTVRVPTLVLHRTGDTCLRVEEGRYVASRIPNAKMIELAGIDHLPFVGNQDEILEAVEHFLSDIHESDEADRVLATILFAQFEPWPAPETAMKAEIRAHRGRELCLSGSGPLATFDGPARGIRCALALADSAARRGLAFKAGLHTGECDVLPSTNLGGLAVDIAAEVRGRARRGEILVSGTVRDLVAGSGIRLSDQGELNVTWAPQGLRLFRVEYSI